MNPERELWTSLSARGCTGQGEDKNRGSVDFFWESEFSLSPELETSAPYVTTFSWDLDCLHSFTTEKKWSSDNSQGYSVGNAGAVFKR